MYDLITIGDIKLDTFVVLDETNVSCELKMPECKLCLDYGAKIDVKIVDSQIAGSAPNVAVGLARMKKKTSILSVMGEDTTRPLAIEHLKREGVNTSFIEIVKHERSTYSVVLNYKGEKTILTGHITHEYHLPTRFPKPTWLYVGEMGEGYEKVYRQVTDYAKKDGVLIAMNPGSIQVEQRKKSLYFLLPRLEVLFVNREEAQILSGEKSNEVHKLAGALYKYGPKHVIITDGKNGAYEYGGHELRFCPIFPGHLVEATGAGDSFASGYLGGLIHGESCSDALRWGAINSSSVVGHVGPTKGLLSATEIRKRLKARPTFNVKTV
ncbi:bifunctional hydroxymethylpyrimidine kinase/phosphomethylpyrimidine kinase [Candidatus Uhrbacteria bacterium]|nr:bifunctional hydroxymethylpyrimidine kinase/phosphomethylpyrimidine kinase [Candidatus Uhrbacteria bacterium]